MLCGDCSNQAGARTRAAPPLTITDDGQIKHHGLPPNPHHEFPREHVNTRGTRPGSFISRRLPTLVSLGPSSGPWRFYVRPENGRTTIYCERCDIFVTSTNACAVRVLSPWSSASVYHAIAPRQAIEAVGRAQVILEPYYGRALALHAAHWWGPDRGAMASPRAARARRVLQAFHAVDHLPGCSYADAYEQLAIADDCDDIAGKVTDTGLAIRAALFAPLVERYRPATAAAGGE